MFIWEGMSGLYILSAGKGGGELLFSLLAHHKLLDVNNSLVFQKAYLPQPQCDEH